MSTFNKLIIYFVIIGIVIVNPAKSQIFKGSYIAKVDSSQTIILFFQPDSIVVRRNFNTSGEVKPSDFGKYTVSSKQLLLAWPSKIEKYSLKIIYNDTFELIPINKEGKSEKRVLRFNKIVDEEVLD